MRIGIPTIWFRRGQSYVSLAMRQALIAAGHEVFIYARTGGVQGVGFLEDQDEFNIDDIAVYPQYTIPPEIFTAWIENNKIDVILFNEEQYQKGLARAAKKAGCKVTGYVCREFINPSDLDYYKDYDIVICPTKDCERVVKTLGLPARQIQWGVDQELFKPQEKTKQDNLVRFFHPGGWGGLHERRGTSLVIEAFNKANIPNAKLLVHMQSVNGSKSGTDGNIIYVEGNLKREDLIKYYQYSDIAVLPSKHEGLGLTYMEAQACGLAVLGIDAPPMNEHVINEKTGFNCKVSHFEHYPQESPIYTRAAIVDTGDLAEKMRTIATKDVKDKMRANALAYAQMVFNWQINGKELAKTVDGL